jgi:hypothetical protein
MENMNIYEYWYFGLVYFVRQSMFISFYVVLNLSKYLFCALQKKSTESEVDSLKEEYHQRVASLERKVHYIQPYNMFCKKKRKKKKTIQN